MKRRILALLTSLLALFSCVFSLSACSDGKDGKDGKDGVGVSVSEAYIDDGGNLILKMSDGTEINCGKVISEAGESLYYSAVTEEGETVGYTVRNIGSVSDAEAVIPAIYRGLPVVGIAENAFENCGWITSVTIPESVTYIGKDAFKKCSSLETVNIDSAESWCKIQFGNYTANPLYYATKLLIGGEPVGDVTVPDGVTEVADCLFYDCESITGVTLGSGVTTVGENAFYNCQNLKSATLASVTEIGELAFSDCYELATLQLGNGLKTVGDYAFYYCVNLKEVVLPATVKTLGECAFSECHRMTGLTLNEGLEKMGDCAFAGCVSLSEFRMPDSVTSIGFGLLMFGGGGAGFGEEGNTANEVAKITMSDNITEIPDFAFNNCVIKTIKIGAKVETINYSAFYGCHALESVVIPKSVQRIVSYAFYRCERLATVYYAGNAEEWGKIKIGKNGNDIANAEVYYYSEERPEADGNFWRYENGVPVKW